MNENILAKEVQVYINEHIDADVNKIALAKPTFKDIRPTEIAAQIAAKKKAKYKLPSWYKQSNIYYPPLLSIEQCSSEITATYKANLIEGRTLIDLTAGFGVDSFFFAKQAEEVTSCEINTDLAAINEHNAEVLGAKNITVIPSDGILFLQSTTKKFDTIYLDPARRHQSAKVFKLNDCTPDVTEHLSFLLTKAKRIIIKTAPLLDITAGLSELQNVSEIHIVSVKNECKELLWVIDENYTAAPTICCVTLNDQTKTFSFAIGDLKQQIEIGELKTTGYLYEPDVALLKSGAFNLIAIRFNIQKIHQQSQLYYSEEIKPSFLGRIFKIDAILSVNELKKEKELLGNVIVRNFPERAENLVKKYKIKPSQHSFIIFTQNSSGFISIKATIIQHY